MRNTLSIILFFLFSSSYIYAQNLPPKRILSQVYMFASDTLQGTCFGVDYENQRFIITAKHIFKRNLKNDTTVNISIIVNNQIMNLKAKYYINKDENIDIAVLKLSVILNSNPSINIVSGGALTLAQDVYFLGYPSIGGINFSGLGVNNFPIPLVKKAIISGWIDLNKKDSVAILLLDGHNNPGFSGGPVIYYDNSNNMLHVAGVISGYYFQENEIIGDKTKMLSFKENSGIISCIDIKGAVDIIKRIKN